VKNKVASGNKEILNLKNPYVPNFNNTPAKRTDPVIEASTRANGNQI
jgi:hypothetical protein